MEALLFSLLTILEINEDQQKLVQDHAKELIETQAWVRDVFERLGSGTEEDERVRMLAAGVLMRCQEVGERFQRSLMGV
jgi:telomere length regulation protein